VSRARFALVAGGGTGGHLVPALAVARALADQAGPDSVELVGTSRGIDAELLADCGLPVTLLPGRGLVRSMGAAAVVANVRTLGVLALSVARSVVLVGRRRPAVVVSMGGYASVPVALAAVLWRVPVVLVNVDAVPGAANRLVGRFARVAAVAFAGTDLRRAVVTGAPVRPDIAAAAHPDPAQRGRARQALGLPLNRSVVGAVGGSLGARTINDSVRGLAEKWATRDDVALYHVVGKRNAGTMAPARSRVDQHGLHYQVHVYEDRMPLFYQAADVVVSRAGANTVAELTVVGVPGVLVPLPGAPGDHQSANARVLENAGAAVVIADAQCSADRLALELDALLGDAARRHDMALASAALGRPDAVTAVADLARAHARGAPRGLRPARRP
jgi:UDP-N-acetylglucosamine--N-acetylmuramyl-(pentapeptide) pyrophosphoryl-undecaprenol N-acetylglucosamine transferase